jgi:hypothetical protein
MQPVLHSSIIGVYEAEPIISSGALYHSVDTSFLTYMRQHVPWAREFACNASQRAGRCVRA